MAAPPSGRCDDADGRHVCSSRLATVRLTLGLSPRRPRANPPAPTREASVPTAVAAGSRAEPLQSPKDVGTAENRAVPDSPRSAQEKRTRPGKRVRSLPSPPAGCERNSAPDRGETGTARNSGKLVTGVTRFDDRARRMGCYSWASTNSSTTDAPTHRRTDQPSSQAGGGYSWASTNGNTADAPAWRSQPWR